jgi:magnesium transporter
MRQPSNSQMYKSEDNLFSYHFGQPGAIPGTIRVQPNAAQSEIDLIDYNANQAIRLTNLTLEDCEAHLDTESVSWVDVSGLGSQEVLQQLKKVFQLHPLVLEDLINVPQRPKVEDYEDRLLIITQMVVLKEEGEGFWLEQVSLVLAQHYLLTVQEEPTRDTFEPVRDRIRNNRGTIRQRGVDYLAYALWDTIIDGYFLALESYGERLEALENEVAIRPTKQTLTKIYQIRRELLALRRAIWPQRDAINTIIRDECSLVSKEVRIYFRDCYDHAVQIIDVIETYRELASGLMDVYLSAVGNKMNEVMKILTVISTIFIPLTFVAGIYGMNFNPDASPFNMPELNWYWGYPLFWLVTIAIAFGLSFFFWRRGWFSDTSTLKPH